eukprot:scaffold56744_cov19-Tisochrysis_lutea.AAC.1
MVGRRAKANERAEQSYFQAAHSKQRPPPDRYPACHLAFLTTTFNQPQDARSVNGLRVATQASCKPPICWNCNVFIKE